MKNKIQKNNEKNVVQNSRSSSIKSSWAFRLLVLLVMLTTIFASFAIPASAADPFRGSGKFDLNYLVSLRNALGSSYYTELSNPLPVDFVFNSSEALYITDNKLILEFVGYFPSFQFTFNDSEMLANDFANFPFVSCNYEIRVEGSFMDITVPAGENIIEYIKSQDANGAIRKISRYSTSIGSSGPHRFEFTLNPDGVSYQFEGGIRSVFDLIGSWLSNTFTTLGDVFFDNGSLTVLGGLAIGSLGVSVILLLIQVISNFIRFRG